MEKVDLTYLREMSAGSNDLIFEMVEIYNEQIPELIEQMETLLNQQNWLQLGLIAHKAKSSVAIMGLNDLASKLKQLELDAKEQKNIESYKTIVEEFKATTLASINELNEIVETLK